MKSLSNTKQMISKTFSWNLFYKMPIIGIMRNIPIQFARPIAKHYAKAGLTNLEITMNSKDAEEMISQMIEFSDDNLNIGAGTVCDLADLDKALRAGAQFIVTPIINEAVIIDCSKNKIPVFPGGYTPSEIYKAWSLGADMVKVFPAGKLGVDYIKEILAPLNQIKLLPTGGITKDNFTEFIKAGAKGVGIGSHLFPKHLMETEAWDEWVELLSGYVGKYRGLVE